MPPAWPGRINGDGPFDRAVALAGLAAERGVQALLIRQGTDECRHQARRTDLPAVLIAASPCEVCMVDPVDGGEVRYIVAADRISRESPSGPPAS